MHTIVLALLHSLLFSPQVMQQAIVNTNPPSSGPPVGLPWILSMTLPTNRNDGPLSVGGSFTVGSSSIALTNLGRYCWVGNSQTHTVYLINSSGTILTSTSAVMSGCPGTAVATTTGIALISSTSLTVASGTGIAIGQKVIATGIPDETIILSGSGTSWTMSQSTTSALVSTSVSFYNPFVYGSITCTVLSASTLYYVLSGEAGGGDNWGNSIASAQLSVTADAAVGSGSFVSAIPPTGVPSSGGNAMFGPVNFKYAAHC